MNPSLFHLSPILIAAGFSLLTGCAEKPPEGPAEILVESEPTGGLLSVDGHEVGKTPYTMKQPEWGKHLLQVSKEGFLPLDRVLEVSADTSPNLTLKLQPIQGLVLFESSPPGAEITINGVFKGKAPLYSTDLSQGTYKVAFALDGYDVREMELVIADRTPKLCQMNMKSNQATLRIESNPSGASVVIDGINKGLTPCSVENVLVGNHSLKVHKDGFKEYTDEIKLTQTGTYPIMVQLEERLATLDITSIPSDASVTINDTLRGRTPLRVPGLRDGEYTILLEKPSYEKVTRLITIQKSEDMKFDFSLERATGTLILNILPQGSAVIVNAELKGVSEAAPFTVEVPPGPCKVEISKPGYHPSIQKFAVALRKTTRGDINLQKIWAKDTIVLLKDGRSKEGLLISKYPNGGIRLETSPGIFEEFTAEELQSVVSKP